MGDIIWLAIAVGAALLGFVIGRIIGIIAGRMSGYHIQVRGEEIDAEHMRRNIEGPRTMTNWTELADAFRAATGPDRELDARLALACGRGPGEGWTLLTHSPGVHNPLAGCWEKGNYLEVPPRFSDTLHIGQTINLLGEVLPGWRFSFSSTGAASVWGGDASSEYWVFDTYHPERPALALCALICMAMGWKETRT